MMQQNPNDDDEDYRAARVMAHLKDSVISKLRELNPSIVIKPHHSSLVQHRLKKLFPGFHTPTHPPYALMIRNAILGLEEGTGAKAEAISEFIKRENNDLPWAHERILSLQLRKLCEIGEIEKVSGGRYALKAEDDERVQCKSSKKKRKKGKRRSKRVVEEEEAQEEEERWLQVFGKQKQQHAETEVQDGLGESQNQVLGS